jgi:hypothetical protein
MSGAVALLPRAGIVVSNGRERSPWTHSSARVTEFIKPSKGDK